MTKVSNVRRGPAAASETPSQQIIRSAQATKPVIDALGRHLLVRQPGIVQRMRVFKVIGAEASKNEIYLGHAMLAVSVLSIDGVPVDPVLTLDELEELLELVGDEGIEAAAGALGDETETTEEEKAAAAKVFTKTPPSAT